MTYNDSTLMPYGEHTGTKLANVPADYLLWLYDKDKASAPLREYIEYNMDVLRQENTQISRISFTDKFTQENI